MERRTLTAAAEPDPFSSALSSPLDYVASSQQQAGRLGPGATTATFDGSQSRLATDLAHQAPVLHRPEESKTGTTPRWRRAAT